jgi:ABC-type transport system involved in multi-copper enzyme maturation permease subunit
MKFLEIFRFEFAYQLRRPWPWLFAVVLLALSFLVTRDGSLSAVLYSDFFLNGPFAIAKNTIVGGLVWLIMAAAIAGDAAARDVATGMYPLAYTAPISKVHYLGGRFLAAFALNALLLLSVQVGILLGVYLPGVDAQLIGPFRPAAFLTAYAFIALPNAFVATAVQFLLALRSGRAMAAYFGSFLIVFMGFFVASMLLFKRGLGTLLDPIGIRFVIEDIAHLWTPTEKNWRLLELEGIVLQNRLLWLGIGLVAVMITYLTFHFAHRTAGNWWTAFRGRLSKAYAPTPNGISLVTTKPIPVPQVRRTFGFTFHLRQALAIAWTSFRSIATSWAGLAVLAAIPLMAVPVVVDQMVSSGTPIIPTTARVLAELTSSLSDEMSRWVIIPFLIVFFAGELVGREREAGLGEITDTMPGSDWAPFLGKFLGLGLLLVVFLALLGAAGMLAQVLMGYSNFDISLYAKVLFGLQLTEYLLFALLALVVHVVVDQKYIGHLVAVIVFVFIAIASLFGIEHNGLIYGAAPGWSYTEMSGFGPSLGPWLWFKAYWAAWALLLAVGGELLWPRGRERSLKVRLQTARHRLTPSTAVTAGIAGLLVLALGGFLFYNTNVLNEYHTASEAKEQQAAYEQRYQRYPSSPQPSLTATTLQVEIYPKQRAVDISGTYRLVNRSTEAIDSIHLATAPRVETKALAFNRAATPVLTDEALHHRIYKLEQPLPPGDSLRLTFKVRVAPKGFRESGADASVVENGSFFMVKDWLPAIGYQRGRELMIPGDRREHGLPSRPVIASLYDVEARKRHSEGVAFEAVVGTQKDQVAVAPGVLRRTRTEGDRRYFHYATNGPIAGEHYFFSAKYGVHEAQWTDSSGKAVAIRIYHHPSHTAHLARMVQGIKASLDYYSKEFGPYQHSQVSFVEHPGDGDGAGMHAVPGMLIYEEGFTFLNPEANPGGHDHPFAVVAHEMAHQWTVPYANVEGAPVMSESLAWYYGIKLVEHTKGQEHLHKFLKWLREPYVRPTIRRGEPLLRGLDPYMSYRKGPFALYALSEYLGERPLHTALRRLLEQHRHPGAPLATTLDLYRELQAVTPDSLQYLLHDLFEVNTYWELEMEDATAVRTKAGTWQVTLTVGARKVVDDSAGVQTEVPMNDWIPIGVFAPSGEDEDLLSGKPLYKRLHRIRTGKQTITLTVPQAPGGVAIDPYQLLIDLNTENNYGKVIIKN